MTAIPFAISEALRFGWEALKRNMGLSLGIGVAGLAAMLLLDGLSQASERFPGLALGFGIASHVLRALWGLVWIRFALSVHDGTPLGPRQLVPSAKAFLEYLAVSILYALLVLAGLVLLVIPGMYFAVRYGFAAFVVAEGRSDALGAFRRSTELTHGARWRLFLLGLVLLAVNMLGALLFGVGLLFTAPITAFAAALVYRRLTARAEQEQLAPPGVVPIPV